MVVKRKEIGAILLLVAIGILISMNFAAAITGRIGNGRMTLNAEVGDTIDRTILVINSNNVTVNITVAPQGGLENDTNIVDKSFILQPGEQKKAEFIINVKQPGTSTTRINVKFTPLPVVLNESGVGLSAQVIINAYGKGKLPQPEQDSNSTNTNLIQITGNGIREALAGNSKMIFLGVSTLFLMVVLVILLVVSSKKKSKAKEEIVK